MVARERGLCRTKASCKRTRASFQKVTFGSLGCRPRAWSVLHCHGVFWPELCRTKATRASWQLGSAEGKAKSARFSSHFRRWRLAVWAAGRGPDPSFTAMVFWRCEKGPLTGAVQNENQLQEDPSKLAVPDPSFTAMVFWPCRTVLAPEPCRTKASCKRTRASWQLAVQKGRQSQGLELVSSRFRRWRLAVWAAGRGPDPSFTAMVFWRCEGPLTGAAQEESCKRTRASWQLAVQKSRQSQGLELVSSHFRRWRLAVWAAGRGPDPSFVLALRGGPLTGAAQEESQLQEDTSKLAVGSAEEQAKSRFGASFCDVWICLAVWAAAGRGPDPFFGAAKVSFDRSCAGRKPAAREHEQVGSWQRRRPRARSVLRCHGVLALREGPLTGAVQDESQLQEDTSKFPLDLLSLLIDKIYLGLLCRFLFNYLQQDIIYYC